MAWKHILSLMISYSSTVLKVKWELNQIKIVKELNISVRQTVEYSWGNSGTFQHAARLSTCLSESRKLWQACKFFLQLGICSHVTKARAHLATNTFC